MIAPTVHLNGTSRAVLVDGYMKAAQAIRDAMTALSETYPNGRDYYTQGPDATTRAIAEHRQRVARLQSVYEELERLAEAVAD